MDAAIPGRQLPPTSTERLRTQPADERQLCCPNCGDPDHLELLEQVEVITAAEFYDVGVTMPEIERDPDLAAAQGTTSKPRVILGFRCKSCRLSVQASDALSRLVRVA